MKSNKETVALWTICLVYFGTNLFHYSTKEMGMSHVYSFFLFCLVLYFTPKFYTKPSRMHSLVMGIILGWIVLIRPTNIIIVLLFILYDVYTFNEARTRIKFFLTHYKSILLMITMSFMVLIPQLMYWKEMTGHWIYYSYTDEGFIYWKNPKLFAVLFDVQNGLFLYSPAVIFMIAGMVYGWCIKKYQGLVLFIIFILATYAFASWWAWWFGGAFGHRSYVEYYALFAIPLSGVINKIFSSPNKMLRMSFQTLLILLMVYSVRLSYLYTSIGGPWDGADWRWNWHKYGWIMSHFFQIF